MLKRLMRRYRAFMQAETIATMRALHDDQNRHVEALHADQNRHVEALHAESSKIIGKELEAAAKSIEAALLTLALHSDETKQHGAEEFS